MKVKNLSQAGQETLGHGPDTVGQAGCMLTCFTMAANALAGTNMTVSQANDIMRANAGFVGSALVTGAFAKQFDLEIEKRLPSVSFDAVLSAIDAGKLVVLGIDLRAGRSSSRSAADHFILAHSRGPAGDIVAANPGDGKDIPVTRDLIAHPSFSRSAWRAVESIFLTSKVKP